MTAKTGLLTVAMLATLSVGSLLAQQPAAPAKADSGKAAMQAAPAKAAPAAKAATAAKSAAPKWSHEQIKEAQEGLARAKLFNATPNGRLGPQTRRAIRAFQRANKLPVTGTLSDTLLVLLKNQQ